MKTLATVSALVVALAAPAFADTSAAIAHFNQSKQGGDVISLTDTTQSTRSALQGDVFAKFNGQADTQDGVRGVNGATLVSGKPSNGADIFARIRAEGLENE